MFRTAEAGEILTDDVFLDPPLWRFQLEGRDTFDTWIKNVLPHGAATEEITDRKILLAEVRGGRIAELIVYCSGDWDTELRARHAAQSQLSRP